MKALVIVLLLIGALMLGHNYLQTGKIGFNVSLSEEEAELRSLDDRLSDAVSAYRVAGRGTSIGGMAPDSTADSSAAAVRRVERDLAALEPRLDEAGKAEAKALRARIASAKAQMGIE